MIFGSTVKLALVLQARGGRRDWMGLSLLRGLPPSLPPKPACPQTAAPAHSWGSGCCWLSLWHPGRCLFLGSGMCLLRPPPTPPPLGRTPVLAWPVRDPGLAGHRRPSRGHRTSFWQNDRRAWLLGPARSLPSPTEGTQSAPRTVVVTSVWQAHGDGGVGGRSVPSLPSQYS